MFDKCHNLIKTFPNLNIFNPNYIKWNTYWKRNKPTKSART